MLTDASNYAYWQSSIPAISGWNKIIHNLSSPTSETGTLDLSNITKMWVWLESTETIIGINFDDIYVYGDITSDVLAESYIEIEMRNHYKAMLICKGIWIPKKSDIIIIKNYYTSAGSTVEQIIFEGEVGDYEQTHIRKIPCFSRAKRDLDEYRPKESLSGDVDSEHLKTLIGKCAYITEGTIDATTPNTSYELKGDKTFRSIDNDLADKHKKMWSLTPTGALNFEDADVDSGEVFFFHKAEYNFKDETVGTTGTDIEFVDVVTTAANTEIITSIGGHKKVLKQSNVGGNDWSRHNFDTYHTSGIVEYWGRITETDKGTSTNLYEGGTIVLQLYLCNAFVNMSYNDGILGWTNIQAVAVDTSYHITIQWYADNTFDLWVNGIKRVDGGTLTNNQVSGVNRFLFQTNDTISYLDAFDESWASGYSAGRNLKGEIDKVWGVRPTKQVREINKVLIYGALVNNVQLEATAVNQASIDEIGEILYKDTYAMITDQTELNLIATNLLSREAPTNLILSINFWVRYINKGLYQVGETGWFADLRANPEIAPQQMIFRKIKYFFVSQKSYFEVDSGLVFKKNKDKSLPQENSLLIQQNAESQGDFIAGNTPMSGNLDMDQHKIIDLSAPLADNDAARKAYVDSKANVTSFEYTGNGSEDRTFVLGSTILYVLVLRITSAIASWTTNTISDSTWRNVYEASDSHVIQDDIKIVGDTVHLRGYTNIDGNELHLFAIME